MKQLALAILLATSLSIPMAAVAQKVKISTSMVTSWSSSMRKRRPRAPPTLCSM